MALSDYRKKRAFSRTSEPRGNNIRPDEKNRFVVHKHSARRLHYDLRLEMGGVLKSWAVPKGPSLVPSEKRLAVNVEDHPLEYAGFEGDIPKGEYGAGKVTIWDKGKWKPLEKDPLNAYKDGTIKFILQGKKLNGKWTLVRMKNNEKDWLLIKDSDDPESDIDILKTGKALKSPMPALVKPQLAAANEKPPAGDSWIYEIKYDGYRIMSYIDHGKVKLVTRNGYDWTDKFKNVAQSCLDLPIESGILDGEIIAPDEKGVSSFELLQSDLSDGRDDRLQYIIFDIIYYNGYDIKKAPLAERKRLLERILANNNNGPLILSGHLAGQGPVGEILQNACRLSLEGIMAKDITSVYEEKRANSWIKIKCLKRQEFVIGGFTKPRGSRSEFSALLLGFYRQGNLIYCGKVGTGFNSRALDSIFKKLNPLKDPGFPFL